MSRSSNYTLIFYGYMQGRLSENTKNTQDTIVNEFIKTFNLLDDDRFCKENIIKNYNEFSKLVREDIKHSKKEL